MRSNKNGLVKDYHLHNNTKTRPWASIGFTSPRFLVGFVLLDVDVVCPFVLFPLAIVLSVLLRFTDYDYPFGILDLQIMITPLVS